jgi:hypothetical protein
LTLSVPANVFTPPILWSVVRSTKFGVEEPVPPLATGSTPFRALAVSAVPAVPARPATKAAVALAALPLIPMGQRPVAFEPSR